jgi:N-acetylmuramoyl-L-alanine amidase
MKHVVKDGDCIASLAAQYGFADGKTIWDHPDNAALKQLRADPNQLHPGDEVTIPDRKPKTLSLAADKKHKIVVKRPMRLLRIKFLDADGEPLKGPYKLTAGTLVREGQLDGDGVLQEQLPPDVVEAEVEIDGVVRAVHIGHLNPMRDTADGGITGAQARLANLGYAPGAVDGDAGPKTRAAIAAFQEAHGLEPTGELDDATIAKLESEHAQ